MCKRIISLLIACIMCVSLGVPVFAATATALKFEKTSDMKAEQGKTYRREAITTPEGATVTYSSSDTKIATVDNNGRVKAIANGKAVITAKSGKITANYNVVVSKSDSTTTSTKTQKSVPKEGYKTIWECAEAHPGNMYVQRQLMKKGPQTLGNWFPLSYAKYDKYNKEGFDSKEEWISVMYTPAGETEPSIPIIQNPKTGKWSTYWIDGTTPNPLSHVKNYYTTVGEVKKIYPDYVKYVYTKESGWTASSDVGDGYSYPTSGQYQGNIPNRGPYNSKAAAESAADSLIGYSFSAGFGAPPYPTYHVVSTKLHQNEHTGMWFVGVKIERVA